MGMAHMIPRVGAIAFAVRMVRNEVHRRSYGSRTWCDLTQGKKTLMRKKLRLLTALAAGWVILAVGSASPQSSIGGPKKQSSVGGPASQKSLVVPPLANPALMPQPAQEKLPSNQKSLVLPPPANPAPMPQPAQEKRPSKR